MWKEARREFPVGCKVVSTLDTLRPLEYTVVGHSVTTINVPSIMLELSGGYIQSLNYKYAKKAGP